MAVANAAAMTGARRCWGIRSANAWPAHLVSRPAWKIAFLGMYLHALADAKVLTTMSTVMRSESDQFVAMRVSGPIPVVR